jgi:hypothetical protein
MPDNPLLTLFGSKSRHTVYEDGSEADITETVKDGKIVSTESRYCETVKITSEGQVLNEFIDFMDFVRADRKRFDPEFKLRTDKKTGQIYRAQKLWSEPE